MANSDREKFVNSLRNHDLTPEKQAEIGAKHEPSKKSLSSNNEDEQKGQRERDIHKELDNDYDYGYGR